MNETSAKPKSLSERIEILEKDNLELQKQLTFEKYKLDTLQTQLSNSHGNIANLLTIFSVLFGIFLVGFGIYIQRQYKRIRKANRLAQETHGQIKQIRQDIDENFLTIYNSIIEEELNSILGRLSNVPEDIEHYSSFFLGKQNLPRDIYKELTRLVSLAQERPMTPQVRGQCLARYFLIILQHYPRRAFENEEIWSGISPFLRELLSSFNHKDMFHFIGAIFQNRHPDWFKKNEAKLSWLFGNWFHSPFANILYFKELVLLTKENIVEIKTILSKEQSYKWLLDTIAEAEKELNPT